jgi:chaperone required for assembly of F1-ATPase
MTDRRDQKVQNPLEAARRLSTRLRVKRFYDEAAIVAEGGGFALHLDGKRAMTPGRNPLKVPSLNLGEAIAAEWRAQGPEIDPASMPVTRLANSAIDGVASRMDEVRGDVLSYAKTDLLYYRAAEPEGLVARQHEAWDPILAWAERRFGVRFMLAEGIAHVAQSPTALSAIAAAVAVFDDPFRLAGLHLATTLTGSALIALALSAGGLGVEEAWAAAHVDEDWNINGWSEDAEAAQRRARRFQDFRAAALALGIPPLAGEGQGGGKEA